MHKLKKCGLSSEKEKRLKGKGREKNYYIIIIIQICVHDKLLSYSENGSG